MRGLQKEGQRERDSVCLHSRPGAARFYPRWKRGIRAHTCAWKEKARTHPIDGVKYYRSVGRVNRME